MFLRIVSYILCGISVPTWQCTQYWACKKQSETWLHSFPIEKNTKVHPPCFNFLSVFINFGFICFHNVANNACSVLPELSVKVWLLEPYLKNPTQLGTHRCMRIVLYHVTNELCPICFSIISVCLVCRGRVGRNCYQRQHFDTMEISMGIIEYWYQ